MTRMMVFFIGLIWALQVEAEIDLRPGDLLLQPLRCWACSLIEEEEETLYSHIGVVLSTSPLVVAEAFGKVRAVSFKTFDAKTEMGQRLSVLRIKNPDFGAKFLQDHLRFNQIYFKHFDGLKYDKEFLWDNMDLDGREKLYCSELVTKLYGAFLNIPLPLKVMHFDKNREQWDKFFKGQIPDGKWGNSPADFEHSKIFEKVGEL